MRTFEELLNTEEPGWAVVQDWLREATNPVEVLPPVEANRESALVAIRVTTLSPMGAIICAHQVRVAIEEVLLGKAAVSRTWTEASERHQRLYTDRVRNLPWRGK
jgi:hypothetical protein